MNKQELIEKMALKTEATKKDTEKALKAFVDVVTETLSDGGDVNIIGFGKFSTTEVAERKGITQLGNAKGTEYVTPAHTKPCFKFGKSVKDLLKNN